MPAVVDVFFFFFLSFYNNRKSHRINRARYKLIPRIIWALFLMALVALLGGKYAQQTVCGLLYSCAVVAFIVFSFYNHLCSLNGSELLADSSCVNRRPVTWKRCAHASRRQQPTNKSLAQLVERASVSAARGHRLCKHRCGLLVWVESCHFTTAQAQIYTHRFSVCTPQTWLQGTCATYSFWSGCLMWVRYIACSIHASSPWTYSRFVLLLGAGATVFFNMLSQK